MNLRRNEKKDLLSKKLLYVGLMAGVVACGRNFNKITYAGEEIKNIDNTFSKLPNYYIYCEDENSNKIKVYDSSKIVFYINKNSFEVLKCLYVSTDINLGLSHKVEVYDLETEKMVVYVDGTLPEFNLDLLRKLQDDYYEVRLNDINKYFEDYNLESFVTYDQLCEIEPYLVNAVKAEHGIVRTK